MLSQKNLLDKRGGILQNIIAMPLFVLLQKQSKEEIFEVNYTNKYINNLQRLRHFLYRMSFGRFPKDRKYLFRSK